MVPSQPTDTSDVAGRLALIEDAEQLRENARLDGPMYQATKRFIDSLYGPTARPIQVKGVSDWSVGPT